MSDPNIPKPKHPWDRQPNEPRMVWKAFIVWRDLPGVRLMKKVSAVGVDGKHHAISTLHKWSTEWKWTKRANLWDQHVQHFKDEKQKDRIATMSARHARHAMEMIETLIHPMQELQRRMKTGEFTIKKNLTAMQTSELFKMLRGVTAGLYRMTEVERKARQEVETRQDLITNEQEFLENKVFENLIRDHKELHDMWIDFQMKIEEFRKAALAKQKVAQ